ncbi:hypothetical protein B0T20DRAFT_364763 [Sordaria brevicollis]|uniref:Uncharacterized protein n=1 Tax=Sordaria brevicollis TaxID=83679 RepID=A0AAE0NVG2_SORBR|nr:hypothetical protein B0T20DRAFT_364763 [Sordaria brevicollis]
MAAPNYPYANGPFSEDLSPAPGSSPPPPYHIVVANRSHRGSTSYPQGQRSPTLTTFPAPTGEFPTHGSQIPGYAVLASEMTGPQGQIYHQLVQMPYPGIGYPPGSPPVPLGFPPPRSPPQSPRQVHIVHQPLPTHTGRDPGLSPSSDSASTLTLTANSTPSANSSPSANPTHPAISSPSITDSAITTTTVYTEPPWTDDQDRLLTRLRKNELNSHLDISAGLEDIFQVKRSEDAIKKRVAHLKARRKAWREEVTMASLNSVMQTELAATLNSSVHQQCVQLRQAAKLELERILAQDGGILTKTMQERMVSDQKEKNEKYRALASMERKEEHSPEREWEQLDGDDSDGDQASQGEGYEVL